MPGGEDRLYRRGALQVGAGDSCAAVAGGLSFGAVTGYATYGYTINLSDGSKDTGLLYVWMISGFVGSLLIAIKNRRITDKRLRLIVSLADVAVLAGALLLVALLPDVIAMLKGLVLLALFFPYLVWYRKAERRLVPNAG